MFALCLTATPEIGDDGAIWNAPGSSFLTTVPPATTWLVVETVSACAAVTVVSELDDCAESVAPAVRGITTKLAAIVTARTLLTNFMFITYYLPS